MAKARTKLTVPVNVWSDSHEVEFGRPDASDWLASLSDNDLAGLERRGWGLCELADRYAEWLEGKGDSDARALFVHLGKVAGLRAYKDQCGFEVQLDADEADKWLAKNRPGVMTDD